MPFRAVAVIIADFVRALRTVGSILPEHRAVVQNLMPRGRQPSTAALTRSGARNASEIVILT
jgi:hypothetical protein